MFVQSLHCPSYHHCLNQSALLLIQPFTSHLFIFATEHASTQPCFKLLQTWGQGPRSHQNHSQPPTTSTFDHSSSHPPNWSQSLDNIDSRSRQQSSPAPNVNCKPHLSAVLSTDLFALIAKRQDKHLMQPKTFCRHSQRFSATSANHSLSFRPPLLFVAYYKPRKLPMPMSDFPSLFLQTTNLCSPRLQFLYCPFIHCQQPALKTFGLNLQFSPL